MRSLISRLAIAAVSFSLLTPITITQASASPSMVSCINLQSGAERISRTGKCRIGQEAQANWQTSPSDSVLSTESNRKTVTICSNKPTSTVSYRIIRSKCARHQVSTLYSRSASLASAPIIASAISRGYNSAALILTQDLEANLDTPVAYYTVTNSKGEVQNIYSWQELSLVINKLNPLTTYTFTVTATTADGKSVSSAASQPVTTPAYVPPASSSSSSNSSSVAAPAFTLSSTAETKTVNNSISGYTITSTGGAITSYALSPAAPAGTTFSTLTGMLTGTPTESQSTTTYTITAINAGGSVTLAFLLTVTPVVYALGDIGPGGGKIFYVSSTQFTCGPTLGLTCTYLEAAPKTWSGGTSDGTGQWCQDSALISGTGTAIGRGEANTNLLVTRCAGDSIAKTLSTLTLGGKLDWFLPSSAEAYEFFVQQLLLTGDFALSGSVADPDPARYSTSSQDRSPGKAVNMQYVRWTTGSIEGGGKAFSGFSVRPIRAF